MDTTGTCIYSECASSLMPDVSLTAALNDVTLLTPNELASKASLLWKHPRMVGRFVSASHTAACSHFQPANWDRHFEEELNSAINSIPIDLFEKRVFPVKKLLWLGWAVLIVYHLDPKRNQHFLTLIASKLMKENITKQSAQFIHKLCAKQCELQFSLTLFEDLVTASPVYIEELIIDSIGIAHSHPAENCQVFITDDLFLRPNVKTWLNSCSQSPKLFQMSVNIINNLLLHSRGSQKTVTFIQEFLNSVKRLLVVDTNISVLYPPDLQALVAYMDLRPGFVWMKLKSDDDVAKTVLEPLMNGLASDRRKYLCLLSHFPLWMPLLFKYAIANGEAKVFSKKFFEEDNLLVVQRLKISQDVYTKCESFVLQYS